MFVKTLLVKGCKGREKLFSDLLWDSNPRVFDTHLQLIWLVRKAFNLDCDTALLREFNGIRQEVHQNLLEPVNIVVDHPVFFIQLISVQKQLQLLGFSLVLQQPDNIVHCLAYIKQLRRQSQHTFVYLAVVHQVVHDHLQKLPDLDRILDGVLELADVRHISGGNQHAKQRVQGRADVVAHACQQLVLVFVQLFQYHLLLVVALHAKKIGMCVGGEKERGRV